MIKDFFQRLIRSQAHLFLAPVLFILAANNQRKNEVDFTQVLMAFVTLELISLLIFYLFIKRAQRFHKAAAVSTYVLCFILFFANLRSFFNLIFASRNYIAFLALFLICAVLLVIMLRSKASFVRLNIFLNLFILASILNEGAVAFRIHQQPPPPFVIRPGDVSSARTTTEVHDKPNVYLMLFDAYPSFDNLKKHFGFDNDSLLTFLRSESFYIPKHSKSNYKSTIQTLSSLFNAGYLPDDKYYTSYSNSTYAYLKQDENLRHNSVLKLLHRNGYDFINLSIFNMEGSPSPVRTDLHYFSLNSYDYYYFLYAKTVPGYLHSIVWKYFEYNRERKGIRLMDEAINSDGPPKFVYFHSMIVHEPYYFKANGELLRDSWFYFPTHEAYIQQVRYANSVIRDLVGKIKTRDKNAIIVLMSDHGFRNLKNVSREEILEESYSNFYAVYFPGQRYHALDDGVTPVNLIRIVLNEALQLKLERLPDKSGLQ